MENLNPSVPKSLFLYPQKTSIRFSDVWVEKGYIGNKWVKMVND